MLDWRGSKGHKDDQRTGELILSEQMEGHRSFFPEEDSRGHLITVGWCVNFHVW